MNYNARMLEIIEKLGPDPKLSNLIQVKDDLTQVANYVQKLSVFKDDITQLYYNKFIKELDAVRKKDLRILTAWHNFVVKAAHAPTQQMLEGVVICFVPAIVYSLNSREDSKIILFQ
jgi:hypothetical protein